MIVKTQQFFFNFRWL